MKPIKFNYLAICALLCNYCVAMEGIEVQPYYNQDTQNNDLKQTPTVTIKTPTDKNLRKYEINPDMNKDTFATDIYLNLLTNNYSDEEISNIQSIVLNISDFENLKYLYSAICYGNDTITIDKNDFEIVEATLYKCNKDGSPKMNNQQMNNQQINVKKRSDGKWEMIEPSKDDKTKNNIYEDLDSIVMRKENLSNDYILLPKSCVLRKVWKKENYNTSSYNKWQLNRLNNTNELLFNYLLAYDAFKYLSELVLHYDVTNLKARLSKEDFYKKRQPELIKALKNITKNENISNLIDKFIKDEKNVENRNKLVTAIAQLCSIEVDMKSNNLCDRPHKFILMSRNGYIYFTSDKQGLKNYIKKQVNLKRNNDKLDNILHNAINLQDPNALDKKDAMVYELNRRIQYRGTIAESCLSHQLIQKILLFKNPPKNFKAMKVNVLPFLPEVQHIKDKSNLSVIVINKNNEFVIKDNSIINDNNEKVGELLENMDHPIWIIKSCLDNKYYFVMPETYKYDPKHDEEFEFVYYTSTNTIVLFDHSYYKYFCNKKAVNNLLDSKDEENNISILGDNNINTNKIKDNVSKKVVSHKEQELLTTMANSKSEIDKCINNIIEKAIGIRGIRNTDAARQQLLEFLTNDDLFEIFNISKDELKANISCGGKYSWLATNDYCWNMVCELMTQKRIYNKAKEEYDKLCDKE